MARRLPGDGASPLPPWKVSVAEHGSTKFLGFLCFDTEVHIVLHFESGFLSGDVKGGVHRGVSWINMREQRRLSGKPAKRLHAWLSAWAGLQGLVSWMVSSSVDGGTAPRLERS